MMTQEQAKAKLATAETKVEHLEAVSNRLEWLANETDGTRFAATEDWKLFGHNEKVDNEFWWTLEDAINELFAAKNLCDEQLNRERNKVKVLADYLTRFENEATPATVTDAADIDDEDGAHCFECGKYVADAHDMESGMWVQPSHESGTVNEESFEYSDRYYSEFVCRECYDKHYHQCDECCESYHESRCTQDTNSNFICENCRDTQTDADKPAATNSVDIDDEDTATEKSSDEIADELTAKLQQKICPATWHVHTRLQGDRGYRSLILSKLTVEHDWYDGHGYNFIIRREVLAHYDTAAQVEAVIGRIGAVATFKETEFNFPHVAELTATEYREKLWAVDFDICHEDSDLTEEELRDYTDALSDAMTANGNRAHVELETCVITIYGDSDGDNLTVDKIVAELETRGCRIVENYEEWEVNKAEEDAAE